MREVRNGFRDRLARIKIKEVDLINTRVTEVNALLKLQIAVEGAGGGAREVTGSL